MTWALVWQILLIAAVLSLLISMVAYSIIDDLYKARRSLEMGRSNGWRPIKIEE
jgi:hypothetical protein